MSAIVQPISGHVASSPARASSRRVGARGWTGRILTGLSAAFLIFDAVIKLIGVKAVEDGMARSGWPMQLAFTLGVILLSATILYLIPRTAVIGAILLTGYLGGAVATQLRVGNPLAGYVLFPVYVGIMVWGGLYLRDARLRALIPLRGFDA